MANGNGDQASQLSGSDTSIQQLAQALPQIIPQTTPMPQDQPQAQPGAQQAPPQPSVAPERDLSKEPIFDIKAGHYGFKGDSTMDANSASGKSTWNTPLTTGLSMRLSPDMRARLNAAPNDQFVFKKPDGTSYNVTFNDQTSDKYHGMMQVYDKDGKLGELGEGTISRPGATGPAVPTFRMDDERAARMPGAFGLRVADQDDVARYDQFKANGGDENQIPIYDRAGLALAKDPDFFFRPENREAAWQLIGKPLSQQRLADQFSSAVWNAPGNIFSLAGDIGQAVGNGVKGAMDAAELTFQKLTGWDKDEDQSQLMARLAQEQATGVQGAAQIATNWSGMITGMYNNVNRIVEPLALRYVGNDPQAREEVERNYFNSMLDMTQKQQQAAKLGNIVQAKVADAYQTIGLREYADKLKTAQPNLAAVSGVATIADPLNYIGGIKGAEAIAIKPVGLDKTLQALEDSTVADAKKTALNATQIQPSNPEIGAANPSYTATRDAQAKLAPVARAATNEANQSVQNVAQTLTSLNKLSTDPGSITQLAAKLSSAIGVGLDKTGAAVQVIKDWPEMIANRYAGGNPMLKKIIGDFAGKTVFGGAIHLLGPVGGFVESAAEHYPEIADALSGLFKAYGKELPIGEATIPLHTRVAQQTKLMPKGIASALDSTLMQNTVAAAKGAVHGAVAQGALGAATGGVQGAVGGAFTGGILGGAGGGLGQWLRYNNPNEYLLQQRGDWKRYRDSLSTVNTTPASDVPGPSHQDIAQRAFEISQAKGGGDATANWVQAENELKANPPQRIAQLGSERDNFDKLSPTNQLFLSSYAQHYPALKVQYVNMPGGPKGRHFFDDNGGSNIQINLADPSSVVRATMAHELIHGAATSGFLPQIYDSLFGNPMTGKIGQFTALDAMGKPIGTNPVTGRYQANQDFYNLADQYKNAMIQSRLPTSQLNDFSIAKEIYAENGADYLMSGAGLLDAASAFRPGLFSESAYKTALMKMGYAFDDNGKMIGSPGGTVSGTGLFTDLQRNPELQGIARGFFATTEREGRLNVDDRITHRFNLADIQSQAVADSWLSNSNEIMRRPDGTAIMDPLTGLPVQRTPKQTADYNAKFAGALRDGLSALPEADRMDAGMRITTDDQGRQNIFTRYIPSNLLDSLGLTNEYNAHQLAALRMLSTVLADKGTPGMEVRMFYNKALTAGKKYRGFEGSERFMTPYGFEITHDNQINIKGIDFQQLNKNFQRVSKREPFNTLWGGNPDSFTQDAHTYFTNHSQGRPGAEGIGEQKRDAINALAGFGTVLHRESNPLVATMPKGVQPIVNSYRIDRANQIAATGAMRPFISEGQYYAMNRNYLPTAAAGEVSYAPRKLIAGAAGAGAEPAPDTTAIPVTYHQTAKGNTVEDQIPYGITKAPLVADKQPIGPMGKGAENNYSHLDFLSGRGQKQLTALDNNSAVNTYADKLVDEFNNKWKDLPSVMVAKTWYKDVRGLLKKGFGKDAELFGHLLAATSAGQGVVENWKDALVAYHRYQSGAFDDAIREYKRTGQITEDMKPTKADNVTKFGQNSDEVLKVLAGTWMDEVQGPKTPNFFANLFGRGKEATIDLWAARTMRRLGFEGVEGAPDQWRIQPASESGVSNLDFAFSQQVFRRAAERLGMDPHELQAIAWYGEKQHWADRGWTRGAGAAKESYIPMLKAYAEHVQAKPNFSPTTPDAFIAARNKTSRPGFLSDLKPEDLGNHQLFLDKSGKVGAAVDPNGDIQNVFNNSGIQGRGAHAVIHAINNLGGRTLDAFEGHLPDYYTQFGFNETGRVPFDPNQAPANWNHKQDDSPDVVFMRHDGYPQGGEIAKPNPQEAALRRAWDKSQKSWIPRQKAS